MSENPTVTLAQIRAAYDALGLEADRWNETTQVVVKPDAVIVTRYLRGDNGRAFLASNGEIAQEMTVLKVSGGGVKTP